MSKYLTGGTVLGVPAVNELTNQGIVNALALEEFVWLGLTYGAWFKIGMGVALLLLIVERSLAIYCALRK